MMPRGLAHSIVCRTVTCGKSKQQKGPVQPRTFRRCICPIAGTGSSTVGKNERPVGRGTTAQPRDETDCRALLLLFRE